jgi:hypothetical protein
MRASHLRPGIRGTLYHSGAFAAGSFAQTIVQRKKPKREK